MRPGRANIAVVLAALNFGALALGVASGALTASLTGVVTSGLLTLIGFDTGPDIGLVVGILLGLITGGWVAGLRSVHSHRFHGMVTGLVMAALIIFVARRGGSPADTSTIIWLIVLSIAIAGFSGWLAGRRRNRPG